MLNEELKSRTICNNDFWTKFLYIEMGENDKKKEPLLYQIIIILNYLENDCFLSNLKHYKTSRNIILTDEICITSKIPFLAN